MKIASLNGWGGKLHAALIDWLVAADPDVLCLQEVVHTPASEADWLTYRDGDHVLAQRANFFREVSAALPGHGGTFCPAARGDLYEDGRAIPSFWGLATFVRSGFPVIGQVQGFVHKGFSPDGYGEHPRSRPAHAVRLYDEARGGAVVVAQMHGLRDPRGKIDTPERAAQARRLCDMVAGLADTGDAIVVCGDFNVEPDSETFAILGEIGLIDLVTTWGVRSTRTSHYAKPGPFADYMLIGGTAAAKDFVVVAEPEISDHRPLVLTL